MDFSDGHPFYPLGIALANYQPPSRSTTEILSIFSVISAVIFVLAFKLSGWVVAKSDFFQDKNGNFLSDIWKEYSKADSRYASRDTLVITVEFITAYIEGPLCMFIVYGMCRRTNWNLPLQAVVGTAQLYGCILYYATTLLEGSLHSRPEFLYYYVYFLGVNFIWVIIPLYAVFRSIMTNGVVLVSTDRKRL